MHLTRTSLRRLQCPSQLSSKNGHVLHLHLLKSFPQGFYGLSCHPVSLASQVDLPTSCTGCRDQHLRFLPSQHPMVSRHPSPFGNQRNGGVSEGEGQCLTHPANCSPKIKHREIITSKIRPLKALLCQAWKTHTGNAKDTKGFSSLACGLQPSPQLRTLQILTTEGEHRHDLPSEEESQVYRDTVPALRRQRSSRPASATQNNLKSKGPQRRVEKGLEGRTLTGGQF